jgi:hypothetical protein
MDGKGLGLAGDLDGGRVYFLPGDLPVDFGVRAPVARISVPRLAQARFTAATKSG